MRFIEALAPWLSFLAGVVCLVACIVAKKDKLWFWGLCVATIIVLMIACARKSGPGLLVSEKYPTKEQKAMVSKVFNHLRHGTNAPQKSVSVAKTLPPPKRGTWAWWKSFFILAPFVLICGCFAFEEQIEKTLKERTGRKEEEEKKRKEHGEKKPEHFVTPKEHFLVPGFWDIISILIEVVRLLRGRR